MTAKGAVAGLTLRALCKITLATAGPPWRFLGV